MVSDVYFPRINGVSTSIRSFRDALERHHARITLVAPDYPCADPEAYALRVPGWRIPFDPEDRFMTPRGVADAERRLASADFDLVHVQTPFQAHRLGARIARRRQLPCIATYHTHFEEYFHHYLRFLPRSLLRVAARMLARHQAADLDAIVAPSAAVVETLAGYGLTLPMHVIPTGLADDDFVAGDGAGFRRRHGIGAERKVALFVGRVAHEKNIGFLVDAADHARHRCSDLLLVIAGEGPALPALKEKVRHAGLEHHVCFVGYLERHTELRDCYAAADLFAFASLTETQGLVILEAMAAGLPVLAIPAMGVTDIIAPERGAVLGRPTPPTFAEQMVLLLEQPALRHTLAVAARQHARDWGIEQSAIRLTSVYRGMVADARRPRMALAGQAAGT